MNRIDLAAAATAVPAPRAGGAPRPNPSAVTVPMRGDRIDAPSAAPVPDPNGVCPVPNPARDRQQAIQGLLIGGAVAAAVVAPEVVVATGLDEAAGSAVAAAARGVSSAAAAAGKIGSAAAGQFTEDAAQTLRGLKDPEAIGKAIGHQAHGVLTTLGQSMVQTAIGAGLGAVAYAALHHGTPAQPASGR